MFNSVLSVCLSVCRCVFSQVGCQCRERIHNDKTVLFNLKDSLYNKLKTHREASYPLHVPYTNTEHSKFVYPHKHVSTINNEMGFFGK